MKKILFIFISFIAFVSSVKADEECTYTELNRIRNLASLINFEVKYIGESSNDEYSIYISNVKEDFYISVNGTYYFGDVIVKKLSPKKTYKVDIWLLNNACSNKFHYFRYITIPAYNKYYNSSYCNEYKNIELCKIDYDSSNLTEEQFKKKIDEYIKSQAETDVGPEKIDNKNNNNFIIITSIVLLIIVTVIIIIVVTNKRRKHLL